jgi:hypothetical protein
MPASYLHTLLLDCLLLIMLKKKSTHQDDVADKNPTGLVRFIIKKEEE